MSAVSMFVTGTDTEVGKTYVTTVIARQLMDDGNRVGMYKPCVTGSTVDADGCEVWEDVEALASAIGGEIDRDRISPQRFSAAVAPPVAARLENKRVNADLLRTGAHWWKDRVDVLLVEGVGGLLCPLTESEVVADLARDLQCPLIIVGRLGLGTINHTLMTIEVARNRGLSIAGVILNEVTPCENARAAESNPREMQARIKIPVLGVLPHGGRRLTRSGRPIVVDWLAVLRQAPSGDCATRGQPQPSNEF